MIMEHNTSTSICEIFLKEKGFNIGLYIVTLFNKIELLREKNKYLLEEAHAIAFSMNIPKHLQAEVVLTTSYLINMMSTWVLQFHTPLDCLKNSFLDTEIQYVLQIKFLDAVFVHKPNKLQSKFDPKANNVFSLDMS